MPSAEHDRRPFKAPYHWLAGMLGVLLGGLVLLLALGACSAGERAPDFRFALYQGEDTLGGSTLKLSDLQDKPVVLNFWAGLCPPCRAEMPDLQAFYNEFHDQVALVGVDIGVFVGLGTRQDAQELLRELGITYPAGYALDDSPVRQYRVLNMPTTVFITEEGDVFRTWSGALNRQKLIEIVGDMMAESGS